jgi:hypothetical protein
MVVVDECSLWMLSCDWIRPGVYFIKQRGEDYLAGELGARERQLYT